MSSGGARRAGWKEALVDLLSRHPMTEGLGPAARRDILEKGEPIFLDEGSLLYRSGDPAREVFVVLAGALGIEYPTLGTVRGPVAAVLPAPNFCGESQVIHGKPWSGTGVALFPLTALAIGKSDFETLLETFGRFAVTMYRDVTHRFMASIEWSKHEQNATPAQALARYLLSHVEAATQTGQQAPACVRLSQGRLAAAVGLSRETVNRTLRKWERDRWLSLSSAGCTLGDLRGLSSLLPEGHGGLLLRPWFQRR